MGKLAKCEKCGPDWLWAALHLSMCDRKVGAGGIARNGAVGSGRPGDRKTAERLLSEGVDPTFKTPGRNPTAPRRQGNHFGRRPAAERGRRHRVRRCAGGQL